MEIGIKLPKLVLKKFSGDPLEWNQLRETYEGAIHQITRISKYKNVHILVIIWTVPQNKQLEVFL